MKGLALILASVGSCVLSATIPTLEFIEDVGCRTASPKECVDRCLKSRDCAETVLLDHTWDRCRQDMTSQCKWSTFLYLAYYVEDDSRKCVDTKNKAIMLSHALEGPQPPFGPEAPSGIRWHLQSSKIEACRKATYTVEITPDHQDMAHCTMKANTNPALYEKHEHVPFTVITGPDATPLPLTSVGVIAKNESSKVIKNEGLTVRVTIEQKELADECFISQGTVPKAGAILQGRWSKIQGN